MSGRSAGGQSSEEQVAGRYAPPRGEEAASQSDGGSSWQPASRLRRLAAAGGDAFFSLLVLLVVVAVIDPSLTQRAQFARLNGLEYALAPIALGWGSAFAVAALNGLLIARRGQSVAKIPCRLRIVRVDGSPAGLYRGFILRSLPLLGLASFPSVLALLRASPFVISCAALGSMVVRIVDAAFILGKQRRCLHDRMAGTWVAEIPAVLGTTPP